MIIKPEAGDIWYNDFLGWHVLLMDLEDDPKYKLSWRLTLILETGEYNHYIDDDFCDGTWQKVG